MAFTQAYQAYEAQETGFLSQRQIHLFRHQSRELNGFLATAIAILAHFLTVGTIALLMFILSFLGWNVMKFKRPVINEMIEFQLVEGPDQKPNKPTNIRASQNSRAGGKFNPNQRKAQNLSAKGNKNAKNGNNQPKAAQKQAQPKQQQKPQPKQQPSKPAQQQSKPITQKQPTQQQQQPKQQQAPKLPPKPVAVPTNTNQKQSTQPTPPKAPKPRTTTTSTTSTTTTTNAPSTTGLKPSKVGGIKIPSSGGAQTGASTTKATGPIVGGFPSSNGGKAAGGGSPSGSPGGKPNGGPGFQSTTFSGNPGGGAPGKPGTPGNGGKNKGNQAGSNGQGDGSGVNAKKDVDLGPYIRELQGRIRRNWTPSDEDRSKRIVMKLVIGKDGRLLGANIIRSSGSSAADQAAQLAVQRSAPFMPLPAGFGSSRINVEFTFDQNVYSGGYR